MGCFASSSGFGVTIDLARGLIAKGHQVTPHLPVRSISGPAHLTDLLQSLQEADIRDVFVVAGNTHKAVGPYTGAIDVLEAVRAAGFTVGVAAHPEGHPYLNQDEAIDLLRRKQRFASYLVTQTCFDHAALRDWFKIVRARGVELPAYVGVAGVVQRTELLRMAAWMGVGKSIAFVRKQRKLATHMMGPGCYDPSSLMDCAVDAAVAGQGILGIHLNTFNQVRSTRVWWESAQQTSRP